MPDEVQILGIDPALSTTGYGVITAKDDTFGIVDLGEIRTSRKNDLAYRLHKIYSGLKECIIRNQPDIAVLEEGFYSKNIKIALSLGQARGAAMVACAECGLEVRMYAAREIKQSVVGRGAASKEQVAFMVKSLLGEREGMDSFDVTDALGAAICAALRLDMEREDVRLR